MTGKVFITGGTGFIGSNLIRSLVKEGEDVVILSRKNSSHPLLEGIAVEKKMGDITNPKSLSDGMQECDKVYHLCASISFNQSDYDRLYQINVEGTKNILKASIKAGVEKFVHVSACATIGISDDPLIILDEDSKYDVRDFSNPYAQTKRFAELEVLKAVDEGLDAVILNPATVYGRGDKTLNSGILIKNIASNRIFFAPSGGTSWISVDDVVEGLILGMEKGNAGERYILSNESILYSELFNRIAMAVGSSS